MPREPRGRPREVTWSSREVTGVAGGHGSHGKPGAGWAGTRVRLRAAEVERDKQTIRKTGFFQKSTLFSRNARCACFLVLKWRKNIFIPGEWDFYNTFFFFFDFVWWFVGNLTKKALCGKCPQEYTSIHMLTSENAL